jgi:hypothetical protein
LNIPTGPPRNVIQQSIEAAKQMPPRFRPSS